MTSNESSTADYWKGLCEGREQITDSVYAKIPNTQEYLKARLLKVWDQLTLSMTPAEKQEIARGSSLGIIFASTKGMVEDFIWNQELPDNFSDPLTPVLEAFIKAAGLSPKKSICVSNACASSHSALYLAQLWLSSGNVTHVLVLAADRIGPFVFKGFQSLRALAQEKVRSFARNRDGLKLGEAAAALLLSSSRKKNSEAFELEDVGMDAEGYSATRPSPTGESLERACLQLPRLRENPPDLIIAHGTGTAFNDETEDRVFSRLFEKAERAPLITGTKWCIGHTLGASGAMDVIAACKVLSEQKVFSLAHSHENDPTLRGNYLFAQNHSVRIDPGNRAIQRVLVTSLGFGGIHCAALIKKGIVG